MIIPEIIKKDGHVYIYEKQYSNFILYKNKLTGVNECFNLTDLISTKTVKASKNKWERK